jgi:hypothetical protein
MVCYLSCARGISPPARAGKDCHVPSNIADTPPADQDRRRFPLIGMIAHPSRQMRSFSPQPVNVKAHHERAVRTPVRARHLLGRRRASSAPVGAGPYRAASSTTGHGIVRGGAHRSRSAHNAGTHLRRGRRCKSRSHTANRSYAAGPCAVRTARRPPYRSWPATIPTEPSAAGLPGDTRAPAKPAPSGPSGPTSWAATAQP